MEYQQHRIARSADLEVTPAAFAQARNETVAHRALAEAHLDSPKSTQFDRTTLAMVLLAVGTNIASSALHDLVKDASDYRTTKVRANTQQKTRIEEMNEPDGTSIAVVDSNEQ